MKDMIYFTALILNANASLAPKPLLDRIAKYASILTKAQYTPSGDRYLVQLTIPSEVNELLQWAEPDRQKLVRELLLTVIEILGLYAEENVGWTTMHHHEIHGQDSIVTVIMDRITPDQEYLRGLLEILLLQINFIKRFEGADKGDTTTLMLPSYVKEENRLQGLSVNDLTANYLFKNHAEFIDVFFETLKKQGKITVDYVPTMGFTMVAFITTAGEFFAKYYKATVGHCLYCGTPIMITRKDKKFCSNNSTCRTMASRERSK